MAVSTTKRAYYEKLFPQKDMVVGSLSGDVPMGDDDYTLWLEEQPSPEDHALRENDDLAQMNANRQLYYPRVETEVYALIEGFRYLKSKGTDIGPDMDALLTQIDAVKSKFPKPTGITDSYPENDAPANMADASATDNTVDTPGTSSSGG